ncbi:MAG: adenylosuccinate lyase [Phycisphaerales bacterium]|nr:adenylosuccinate lyase [Phycisphaerales bacterium]
MTNPHDTYTSPLAARNASPEMCKIWSPRHKFTTWRKIWLAVAEAQQACGLDITDEQLDEMRAHIEVTDEDMVLAAKYERELRHDVMAHVHVYGDRCPSARGIIHLGCTSQDVVCNGDLLALNEARNLIIEKLERAIYGLGIEADKTKEIPTLGFTHYQPAQPTTVGRRFAGWAYDLSLFEDRMSTGYPLADMRGLRGATGTQASFLKLFDNDSERVDLLEFKFLAALGELGYGDGVNAEPSQLCKEFDEALSENPLSEIARQATFDLTGQTYPRVYDTMILADLASVASVLHKIATDIRLLSNRKEIDEPFGKSQIGSSAMPYKRNPMKCERICGLTRFVMNLVGNAYDTAATQWLERTLDDSSNRRLSLPEAFLALDGALDLMHTVADGLIVNEAMVKRNLMAELPFMATENIMMEAVKLGRDRQDVHEAIRVHSMAAGQVVKQEGKDNDLLDRLKSEPLLEGIDIDSHLDPMAYIGRSVEQTERFIKEVVEPMRERYSDELVSLGSADRGV